MKTLDLFSGTKSFTKIADEFGYETYTLDIESKNNPTFCVDIMKWNYKQFPTGYFHIIWASPNCKCYSSMNFLKGKNQDLTEANKLVMKTLEIIHYFKPAYWFMENPQLGKLKHQDFMKNIPYTDLDYCKYGFGYRKRTRVWHNSNWIPRPLCSKHGGYCKSKINNKHTGINWITRGVKGASYKQKISIPPDLFIDIFNLID
tara:strand:+ start:138 stop:743 length:606 start_codon:yes stop_codon:yes gene_type:complete